jgi:hypothetical protein
LTFVLYSADFYIEIGRNDYRLADFDEIAVKEEVAAFILEFKIADQREARKILKQ